ncbi:MAG: PEP-utilizing enzyme [Gammaproteobacteria bacterium]
MARELFKMTRQANDMRGMPYVPGIATGKLQRGPHGISPSCIVLLGQAEISALATLPAGILVVEAAPFSHKLITLLGLGVPAVLISAKQAESLHDGMQLTIDGASGRVREADDQPSAFTGLHAAQAFGPVQLRGDEKPLQLYASVRQAQAARQAARLGAQAIGLVRSEYLLPPTEKVPDTVFYRDAFRAICEAAAPLTVTFRLLDVAADKLPGWFPHQAAVGRPLGLQGVRLYHLDPIDRVVDAQLAALAQLAESFPLRLLVPFVVRVEEFAYWRDRIREVLPAEVPVGAMAETPASVLDVANLLQEADFVGIGCNDLMQGLYATDRDLAELRYYLDPYAPVLFRLLRQVAEAAADQCSRVQLCGVLPQVQGILPVLLGLGYRSFSVDAPFVPYLAEVIAQTTRDACEQRAAQVCDAITTRDVLALLQLPTDRHPPFSSY